MLCAVHDCTEEAVVYVTGDDNLISFLCPGDAYETIRAYRGFEIHPLPKPTR
jgi:hypothetical protein